MRQEISPISQI